MLSFVVLFLAGLIALAKAVPAAQPLTNFLLVTTTSQDPAANSSSLANVNATSLFDPDHQTDFYLRLIGPGYGSLPTFNMTQATLHTDAVNELNGFQTEQYNSTSVQAGQQLIFDPSPESPGNLGLKDGYLLAVDGEAEGWTVCDGDVGEAVIFWKGNDSSCIDRYIQAVKTAPY